LVLSLLALLIFVGAGWLASTAPATRRARGLTAPFLQRYPALFYANLGLLVFSVLRLWLGGQHADGPHRADDGRLRGLRHPRAPRERVEPPMISSDATRVAGPPPKLRSTGESAVSG
jgi:hypothetical protein